MFKVIQLALCSVLTLVFAGIILGQFGAPPGWAMGLSVGAVAAMWGVGIYVGLQQVRRIEARGLAEARREHAEKQAIADRLAEEEYAAWQDAHLARARMETCAAMRGFINPN